MKQLTTTARKAGVALATAITELIVVLPDGITSTEWCLVALATLGAVGVFAVTNKVAE